MPSRKKNITVGKGDKEKIEETLEALVRRGDRADLETIILDAKEKLGTAILQRLGGNGDELRAVKVLLGRRKVTLATIPPRCGAGTGRFATVSDELLYNILQFVPSHDRMCVFAVCKSWRGLRNQPHLFLELSLGSSKPVKSLGDRSTDSGFLDPVLLGRRSPVDLSLLQHLRLRSGRADPKDLRSFLASLNKCPARLTLQRISNHGSLSHLLATLSRKGHTFLRRLRSLSITDNLDSSSLQTLLGETACLTELELMPDNPWNLNFCQLLRSVISALNRSRCGGKPLLSRLVLHSRLGSRGLLPETLFLLPARLPHLESLSLDVDCTAALTGCLQQSLRDAAEAAASLLLSTASAPASAAPLDIVAEMQGGGFFEGGVFFPAHIAASIEASRRENKAEPPSKFEKCRHLALQLQGLAKPLGSLRMTTEHGFRGLVVQSVEQQEQQIRQSNEKVTVLLRLVAFYFPRLEDLSLTVPRAGPSKKMRRRDVVEGQRPAPPPLLPSSLKEFTCGLRKLTLVGFDFSDAAVDILLEDGDAAWLHSLERVRLHGRGATAFAESLQRLLGPRAVVAATEPGARLDDQEAESVGTGAVSAAASEQGTVDDEGKQACKAPDSGGKYRVEGMHCYARRLPYEADETSWRRGTVERPLRANVTLRAAPLTIYYRSSFPPVCSACPISLFLFLFPGPFFLAAFLHRCA